MPRSLSQGDTVAVCLQGADIHTIQSTLGSGRLRVLQFGHTLIDQVFDAAQDQPLVFRASRGPPPPPRQRAPAPPRSAMCPQRPRAIGPGAQHVARSTQQSVPALAQQRATMDSGIGMCLSGGGARQVQTGVLFDSLGVQRVGAFVEPSAALLEGSSCEMWSG